MQTRWPKKQSLSQFAKLHYAGGGPCRATLIKHITSGDLPGVKVGGKWYIYVQKDGSPAYGYSENAPRRTSREAVQLTGNAMADAILAKTAANNGMRVA